MKLAVEMTRAGSIDGAERFLRCRTGWVGGPQSLHRTRRTSSPTALRWRAPRMPGPDIAIAQGKDARYETDSAALTGWTPIRRKFPCLGPKKGILLLKQQG